VAPLPAWTPTAAREAMLELPVLIPRWPATRILPSLSLRFGGDYTFRFAARVDDASEWVAASPVGPHVLDGPMPAAEPRGRVTADVDAGARVSADIDLFTVPSPARCVSLRITLRADDLSEALAAPMLASVSLSDERTSDEKAQDTGRVLLEVPALSQMEARADLRHRLCSPTSVAMVLGYWRRAVDVETLAAEVFDARHDLYGVWPAAIRAAARRGLGGYLLRFPSWTAAAWCLERGLPVIASVRYTAGELPGAAIESTTGHLVVLTGYEQAMAFVNDPAAPTAAAVPRRYALADLQRVWLGRTGVGYVLFPPAGSGTTSSASTCLESAAGLGAAEPGLGTAPSPSE
jgi:Peptidase_C39 like family